MAYRYYVRPFRKLLNHPHVRPRHADHLHLVTLIRAI